MSNDFANSGDVSENLEWELSDLVDAIAAEIDEAQNTLSLKSHVRGLSFSIKKLSFDIEIKARRTTDGKFRFRTINPDETGATVLRLDFAQVLQSQLTHVRKPLDHPDSLSIASVSSLEFLPDISPDDIKALGMVGIHSLNDLERYPITPSMLAELSRKTQINEYRLRMWLQLPYIAKVSPDSGAPGSTVTLSGGNFGNLPDSNLRVFFQQKPANIKDRQATHLTVEMPLGVSDTGFLIVQVNNQLTNPLPWRVTEALSKLRIGDYRTIDRLDPLLHIGSDPAGVMRLLFRGLAYLDPKDGERVPDLARKWEILPSSKDPERFRVYLHDRIYFHNGDLLTAADVRFTYQKILELENSPWHSLAQCTIKEVIAKDEKTIDFVLQSQNGSALAGLILLLTIGIVPKQLYQSDPARFVQHPAGCGPFQLQDFVPGETIDLNAFPKYLGGKPKLDQIQIQMGMSTVQLMQMLDDPQPVSVNFPDSESLKKQLSHRDRYLIRSVPGAAPILDSFQGTPALLVVQSEQLRERSPNQFDSDWNAHLWYLRE